MLVFLGKSSTIFWVGLPDAMTVWCSSWMLPYPGKVKKTNTDFKKNNSWTCEKTQVFFMKGVLLYPQSDRA